jgi:hypothetical protein
MPRFLSTLLVWTALAAVGRAELPTVRFDRIFPLGATAGSSVEVEVRGANIEDVRALRFDHPGFKAEFVKDTQFRVDVAADVPDGTYDVRLVGRFGVSNPRLFAVAHGLKDIAEKEPNNTPAASQPVEINSAVNGNSDGSGQDVFRIAVRQGQRFILQCDAGKLDSDLDASMTVVAPDGRIIAGSRDYFGRDPFIDLVAPEDGELFVVVHDLSYRGGMPYRLLISDQPHVENVFPRAVEPGKPTELVALGRNFGSAGEPSAWQIDGRSLEQFRFNYTPPADGLEQGGFHFFEHPVDHSPAPTAATCTLFGEQVRVPIAPGAMRPQPIVFAEGPVTLDAEPNDDPRQPQQVTLPLTVSGRFDKPRDADWFTFVAPEGGAYSVEVFSERIAGRADPFVVVLDEKDDRVAEYDDFGHRINAFDGHLRDPVGSVNLDKDKRYRLLVQDRYGRGGARLQYVLTFHRARPDFFVAAIHHENQEPAGVNVWRGGANYLDLVVHQRDGFNSPLTFTVDGLPPGLHAEPTCLADGNHANLVIWSDLDAAEWAGPIRLIATGKRGDEELRREARPHTRVWANANVNSSRPMRELIVAARNQAPFGLRIEPSAATAEQNSKVEVKVIATRYWPDFSAAIRLLALKLPGGFKVVDSQIGAGRNEARIVIEIAGAREGKHTFSLQGQAQVPYDKDPKATNRPNTLVSMPCQPITIQVLPKPR